MNSAPRRQCKPRTAEVRAKISAAIRAKAAQRGQYAWSPDDIATLRSAYARGGNAAAIQAFPNLRDRQVRAAVRRYCLLDNAEHGASIRGAHSVWNDPDFNRRWHEALTGMSY